MLVQSRVVTSAAASGDRGQRLVIDLGVCMPPATNLSALTISALSEVNATPSRCSSPGGTGFNQRCMCGPRCGLSRVANAAGRLILHFPSCVWGICLKGVGFASVGTCASA